MAYFLGAALAVAGELAIDGIQRSRATAARNRAVALWNSPLSRLGRLGIHSLRAAKAVEEALDAIHDHEVRGWLYTGSLTFATVSGLAIRVPERVAVFAPDAVAVVDVVLHKNHVLAVRSVDAAVTSMRARLRLPGIPLHGFACLAGADEDPRDLPGPSGRPVAVTGQAWLTGLLRARLGDKDSISCLPNHFATDFDAAFWTSRHRSDLYWRTVREFPDWWTIRDLRLDDGHIETLDLVCAGPHGVLAIDVSNVDPEGSVARVSRHADRLRAYLPQAEVIPVIVTDAVPEMVFGPHVDTAANPIAWINPEHFAEFARQVGRRGLSPAEIAFLNTPAPHWYRRVGFGPDGPEVLWGWSEQ